MPIPEIVFIILHAPFLVVNTVLVITSGTSSLSLKVVLAMLTSYLITILSYYLGLGDGFAIFHYWALYLATPFVYYLLKVHKVGVALSVALLKVSVFLFLNTVIALCFIYLAMIYSPPRF